MPPARFLPALLGTVLVAGGPGVGTAVGTGMQALPPGAVAPGAGLVARILPLLPGSAQPAQLVKLGSRIASVDLQQRVIEAGGSRKALENVLAVIAKGGVPAYDEQLGISRAEFGKYLAFQPVLVPTGKTLKLPVTRDAVRLTFGEAPGLTLLRGLSIDLRTGELRVPEGFSVRPVAATPSTAPDRSIDIRSAYLWNLNATYNPETQNGINGQLALYQLGNGQVLLRYKRTSMIRGVISEGEVLLSYQGGVKS